MASLPLLSLAIWVPILAGVAVLAVRNDEHVRWIALGGSVLGFLVTIPLYTRFDVQSAGFQFVEQAVWIERFSVFYHLGVDGISVLFVLLNSFITILVVIAGWSVIRSRVAHYYAAFLVMSGMLNGVFSALDALLFYVFFEATLIPMFIIIGVWGGPNRVYAAVKFFLYTLLGSLLMLVSMLYLYNKAGGSFSIADWHKLPLTLEVQILLFFGFLFAFAVKVPMWPVVLAAILLKLGAYGFVRFTLPILPDASQKLSWLMIALSLVAIAYIGLVTLVQTDMKRLIAYSSVSHMGFCTLGFFLFNAYGVEGALVQMISHGFVSAALFLCIGVMYDRMHSRQISDYGGVVNTMPKFAALMMLFAMANAGLPATSGFVGEFMVIMGAMQKSFWLAFVAATTLIWGAAYTLWMYKRVIFGDVANEHVGELKDLNLRESIVLTALAIATLFMGIYPVAFTEVMHASVNELLRHAALPKL
jgi:NADH-quinone oxidoreductase subunit M